MTSASTSIVDLFKNSKPRSKLFIQLIPPGFSEDDFKELIKEYLNEIDYMVFRPGKIIRDPYGHLIGLDCPNYGFATINFKNPRTCPKFHRQFHQFQLSDSYNIKSKLFIEFALLQQIPETANFFESKENFRDLAIFKEFLKTFPFAAKAEEERLASIGPIKIDLEDESTADLQQQQVPIIKTSELDAKLSVSTAPTSPLPQVSFSSLLTKNLENNNSTEAVTPLTEFIKSLSLNETLPPANKKEIKKREENERKEKKRKEKQKKESTKSSKSGKNEKSTKTKAKTKEKSQNEKKAKEQPPIEKKTFSTNKNKSTTTAADPLVEKQLQAPQIKGVPKILARKPVNETKDAAVPVADAEKNKSTSRQPYVPPVNHSVQPISKDNNVKGPEPEVKEKSKLSNNNGSISNEQPVTSANKADKVVSHEMVVDSLSRLLSGEQVYSPRTPNVPEEHEPVVATKSIDSKRKSSKTPAKKEVNNNYAHESVTDSLSKLLSGEENYIPRAPYVPPTVPTVTTSHDHDVKAPPSKSKIIISKRNSHDDSTAKKESYEDTLDLFKKFSSETSDKSESSGASVNTEAIVPSSEKIKQSSTNKPVNQPKKQKGKTLAERSGKTSTAAPREPYIKPENVFLTPVPATIPVEASASEIKAPSNSNKKTENGPKKITIKSANSPKNQSIESLVSDPAPVKKIFTTAGKNRINN